MFPIFFKSVNATKWQFEKIQFALLDSFKKGEQIIRGYKYNRDELDKIQNEYDDYLERNSDEEITVDSAANVARVTRLRNRLWFTVVFEAILSLTAIKFFLAEMLEFNLQWFPAVILGISLAFIILELAIEMRIDDNDQDNDLLNNLKRWSYVIPLVFIPGLNIFIISSTPGNPTNILYAFFAVFSILLNFKTASYWKQYRILKQSAIVKKRIKDYRKNIKNKEKILHNLTFKRIPPINNRIVVLSMRLRNIYESFKTKEKINFILPVEYLFIMNNLIYHTDAFTIPQLRITGPPDGAMRIALDTWRNSVFLKPPLSKHRLSDGNNINNSTEELRNTQESANAFDNSIEHSHENTSSNHDYGNGTTDNTGSSEGTDFSNPDFETGNLIPDSEKYV